MQFLDVTEALVGDQKDSDCMLLRCPLTGEADLLGFTPAIMDFEHPDPTERLMMTGFARPRGFPEGGLVALPFEQAGNIGVFRSNPVARISRVVEVTDSRPMMRNGSLHWRVAMPSEHGMSGGALLRVREPRGVSARPDVRLPQINTTVGIVSSGWFAEGDSDTWISPIVVLQQMMDDFQHIFFNYRDLEGHLKKLPSNRAGVVKLDLLKLLRHKLDRMKKIRRAGKWAEEFQNRTARRFP
jgi:hypothetical protein